MPCSDPTESLDQRYVQDSAVLFIQVAKALGDESVITDYIKNEANTHPCAVSEVSTTPGEFCAYIKGKLAADKEAFETYMYNGRDSLARKLADWWDKHQKRDAKRELNNK